MSTPTQHTQGRLTHAPQVGMPGHCTLAQIWGPDGRSIACIDSTDDPKVATANARRLAACWNACEGIPTPDLEVDNVRFTEMLRERTELRAQRDAARQALNSLLDAINHDDDGGWFICAEAEPTINEANRVSVELAGQTTHTVAHLPADDTEGGAV